MAGQLALAWVHARGEDVFPSRDERRIYLEGNIAAFEIALSDDELRSAGEIVPVVSGDRVSGHARVRIEVAPAT